ncbi:15-cis-phytoene synthase / lycopene beta-cyclase, partial [Tremellales sp. Uapishka_1]
MLTYIQVHLHFILPPILLLYLIYRPLFGRRDVLKISWLCLMATLYTTPWDNFIISRSGWSYPAGSIIGTIFYIPLEEHLFFVLQPILLILLHSICTLPTLLPFAVPSKSSGGEKAKVQTLPRRKVASMYWLATFLVGVGFLDQTREVPLLDVGLGIGNHAFYLGWILVWISPVLGFLTYLGADETAGDTITWVVGSGYLCLVDTIAIRNGAWSIAPEVSLGWQVWDGLPVEEFIFFLLTSHLVILATSLISHLHTLLILAPELPPCPPLNPLSHIVLLAKIALHPPEIDRETLTALASAEETLKRGSKSFEVAKLGFGREMRIGLVAIYAWCRVTDNLMDAPDNEESKPSTLNLIRRHLEASYDPASTAASLNAILDKLPSLNASSRSAFHLFSALIPRLVPVEPFLELCHGYETDLSFRNGEYTEATLPIKTTADLIDYANDVAGSIAASICHLSCSILSTTATTPPDIIDKAREMGRALQLVNIARDVAKDARIGRLYVPLSSFGTAKHLLAIMKPDPDTTVDYSAYTLPLLNMADALRASSQEAMGRLPPTARGGARAMVASYFEIAHEIRRKKGAIGVRGIKVGKWERIRSAARAMWS